MKVTRKILAALLMLMLTLGSIMFAPSQAKADDIALIVGGNSYVGDQVYSESLSGTGWDWNGETRELQITSGYNGSRIYFAGSCTIYTYGTQTISSDTADPAIKVDGKLTLWSEGQLTVSSYASVNTIDAGGDIDFHIDEADVYINAFMSSENDVRMVNTPSTVYVGGQGSLNLKGRSESGKWLVGIDAKNFSTGSWPDSKVDINIDVEGNANSTYGGASVAGIFINTGNVFLVAEDSLEVKANNTTGKQGYGIMQYNTNARLNVNGHGQHHIAGNTEAIACSSGHQILTTAYYYQIGEKSDKDLYMITSNVDRFYIGEQAYSGSDLDYSFSHNGYYWDAETRMLIMQDPNVLYENVAVEGEMLIIKSESGEDPFYVYSTNKPFFYSEGSLAIISDRQLYIYSESSYSTIDVADSLFLEAYEPISIQARSGDMKYIDTVIARTEVVAFGGGHINISGYVDDGTIYSDGIFTDRLLVGLGENDNTKLGVTIAGECTGDNINGILLNNSDSEIITRGHANLDVNAYNYSKTNYSYGYAINSNAYTIKAADFSQSTGLVKLFGSTAAISGNLEDYMIGLPSAEYDGRYIEKFDSDADVIYIGGKWIELDDIYEYASGDGWSYNPYARSVTLNGYNGPRIFASGGAFDIILADGSNNTVTGYIYTDAALRFSGAGNLTIIDGKEGFSPLEANGSIIFKGTGKITINQENADIYVQDGILSKGDIFIWDQTVEVKQSGDHEYYYDSPIGGLHNHGMLMVTGKLTVDSNLVTEELAYNIRIGVFNEDGIVVVRDKGTINSREKAAGFSVGIASDTPLILDGSASPIIFQGDAEALGIGTNVSEKNVLYNSAYTRREYGDYGEVVIFTTSGRYYELSITKTKTLSPSIGSASQITWTSSDSAVATVSSKGVVTAKSYGRSIIRATLKNNPAIFEEWVIQTRFVDVTNTKKYYYDPVYWAAENGITTGLKDGSGKFAPDNTCTRGEFVTFLWRASGEKEPSAAYLNTFPDVQNSSKYYYKPVYWAVEEGITTGLNDGTGRFAPENTVTRGQVVTFLWRAAGEPEPSSAYYGKFSDVKDSSKYYYKAVAWAVEQGITTGMKDSDGNETGIFAPNDYCTRGQVVTFLYRFFH